MAEIQEYHDKESFEKAKKESEYHSNRTYCSKCGKKIKFTWKDKVKKTVSNIAEGIIVILCIFGIVYVAMIFTDVYYFWIPITAINSIQYTRMANEYHPEVQEIADNIIKGCENDTFDLVDCQIRSSREFLVDNFEYENDYTIGYDDKALNMIQEHRNKGDCIDWSITFCSLMRHMHISCLVRSPNAQHYISIIRKDDSWIPLEPQNYGTGSFNDDTFRGFLI